MEEDGSCLEVSLDVVRNGSGYDREGDEVLLGIANRLFDSDDDFGCLTGSESYGSLPVSYDNCRTEAEAAATCGNAGDAGDFEKFFLELLFDLAEAVLTGGARLLFSRISFAILEIDRK